MTTQALDQHTVPADTRMMGIVHSALRRDLGPGSPSRSGS